MKEFSFKYVYQLSLLSNIFGSFSVTSNREAQNDTYLNSINRTNVLFLHTLLQSFTHFLPYKSVAAGYFLLHFSQNILRN